jgi:hypothetical protein
MEYYADSNEEKIKKKKKHKIPKLPKRNIVIKNADKDTGWMESWSSSKNRSPANLIHSYRLLAMGGCGRGKTNYMKQIFLATQCSARKFKRLYVITCDLESKEWDDCCPTQIFDKLPPIELFDSGEKTCVIIDDYEFEKCGKEEMRKLTTLFRMISTHKSVSVLCSYQSFFHVPQIARKVSNVFIIYKPNSDLELQSICNRIGMKYDDLKYLFKNFANGHYDMIMIDKTKDTPYPIRRNLYEIIDYNSDSDED